MTSCEKWTSGSPGIARGRGCELLGIRAPFVECGVCLGELSCEASCTTRFLQVRPGQEWKVEMLYDIFNKIVVNEASQEG